MQACRSLAARAPARRDSEPPRALPGTVRAEVAMLLAEMALAAAVQVP